VFKGMVFPQAFGRIMGVARICFLLVVPGPKDALKGAPLTLRKVDVVWPGKSSGKMKSNFTAVTE